MKPPDTISKDEEEYDDYNDDDDYDFQECYECDGHPSCEDFGCAIKAGLGHLLKNPL